MRTVMVLVTLSIACSNPPPAVDAGEPLDANLGNTFEVPIGHTCQYPPASLCDGGFAACVEGICRPWCGEHPHCPTGTKKHYFDRDADVGLCVCVPG